MLTHLYVVSKKKKKERNPKHQNQEVNLWIQRIDWWLPEIRVGSR